MKKRTTTAMILAALTLVAAQAIAGNYNIDPNHSSVNFKVRHLAISKVKGEFTEFSGTFEYEPGKPETWSCEATIMANSINTGNQNRDDHLRSEDFLFTSEYETISFVSTGVTMSEEDEGKLSGNLTMRGVTKPVVLDLELLGTVEFRGTTRAGFTATGEINRKDFGLRFDKALGTGELVAGDTVEITLEVEGILQK